VAGSLVPPRSPRPIGRAGHGAIDFGHAEECNVSDLILPDDLKPADGRFGCGPSKIPAAALARLAEVGDDLLGTSHRKPRVRDQVRRLQDGLRTLFSLPGDYEVLLTLGGATAFWDAATFGLIERRSRHYVFGEFSSKFAAAATAAPWLEQPELVEAPFGAVPEVSLAEDADVQALTHNETSTGVMQGVERVGDALVLVDATSGAGGLPVDPAQFDAYYFSLQKGLASEGGLTVALLSPAAVERIERVASTDRYVPAFLDLETALDNSRKHQTYNTPSVSTVFLAAEQVDWLNGDLGGLDGVVGLQRDKAGLVYDWAQSRQWASPFVEDEAARSLVVATIDLDDAVSADEVNAVLRANGILDTDAYRKLGRNQLRIGMFPAVDRADLEAYTACVDWIVERIG
jgi:phosphoserine aminotransferase